MKRGDVILVVPPRSYGKPRPAVVIQSDRLTGTDSILVCLLTSDLRDAIIFRFTIEPEIGTGLKERSQVMVDRIFAIPRPKCSGPIGRLSDPIIAQLDERLALAIGLADRVR